MGNYFFAPNDQRIEDKVKIDPPKPTYDSNLTMMIENELIETKRFARVFLTRVNSTLNICGEKYSTTIYFKFIGANLIFIGDCCYDVNSKTTLVKWNYEKKYDMVVGKPSTEIILTPCAGRSGTHKIIYIPRQVCKSMLNPV